MKKQNLGFTPWSDINDMINERFSWAELTKTETGLVNVPDQMESANVKWLADTLRDLENDIGPFTVISAFRSQAVQAAVGKESSGTGKKSFHEAGMAADIYPTTQSIDEFFGKILAGPWKDKLGEIALKPDQNAIHLSLPTDTYRGVAMVVDSAGNYIRQTADEIAEWAAPYLTELTEFLTETDETGTRSVKTWVWLTGALASASLLFAFLKPKKRA